MYSVCVSRWGVLISLYYKSFDKEVKITLRRGMIKVIYFLCNWKAPDSKSAGCLILNLISWCLALWDVARQTNQPFRCTTAWFVGFLLLTPFTAFQFLSDKKAPTQQQQRFVVLQVISRLFLFFTNYWKLLQGCPPPFMLCETPPFFLQHDRNSDAITSPVHVSTGRHKLSRTIASQTCECIQGKNVQWAVYKVALGEFSKLNRI